MYHSGRRRSDDEARVGTAEIVCILLVIAAVAALVAWIVSTAGGGALMT
jgi:hypothetical protein